MKAKKKLALFLVMMMCISLIPVNVFAAADGVTVEKTATPAEGTDRAYDITLELAGDEITTAKPVDITLVFDVSGSMAETSGGQTRLQMTKNAANNFIDSVMQKNGTAGNANNVRVSVVKFETTASVYRFSGGSGWKNQIDTGTNRKYYTDSAETAKNVVNGLSAEGGTNTEAGFMAAKAVTDIRNSSGDNISGRSADSYVIFMTDGIPTFRIFSGEWGNGSNDSGSGGGSACDDAEFNEAVEAANALKSGNTVYTVGLLIGYTGGSKDMICANHLLSDESSYKRTTTGFGSSAVITYAENGAAYSSNYTAITQTTGAADAIKNAYASIANDINARATGTVTDIVPKGFTVVGSVNPEATVVVNPNGTTTITVSNISTGPTTDPKKITYRIIADAGYYGSAFTNVSATYNYTLNETGASGSKTFEKPIVPLAPAAANDTAAASAGQPVTISILANDSNIKLTDGEGIVTDLYINSANVSAVTQTSGTGGTGTAAVNADGTISFFATAAGTYTFTYRASADVTVNGATTTVTSNAATVTVTTVQTDISYTVEYELSDGTKLLDDKVVDGQTMASTVTETAADIAGYTADEASKSLTLAATGNVITFLYAEGANITISYEAGTGGSAAPGSETLAPATGVAKGSTAQPSSGYHFVNWTDKDGKVVGTSETFVPEKVDGLNVAATYTANFARNGGGSHHGGGTTTITDEETPLGALNMVDHFAYIQGYPDDMVRPQGNITREEVAAVFFRLLDPTYRETIRTTDEDFNDVTANRWSVKHIGTLSNGQIITGYPDGSFKPGSYITRAELAAIASRFDNLSAPGELTFSDTTGHWAEKYILSAAEKGWVTGYSDGTFKPNQYITRAEFVTLVNNVLDREVKAEDILPAAKQFPDLEKGKWYYEDMQEAINSHNYQRAEDGHEVWTEITNPSIEM